MCPTCVKNFRLTSSSGYPANVKTVLTRIISIVRVPSLYPNKDNTINRDDDAKRSPLSVKHVVDFVFQGNRFATIDDRSFASFSGELDEVIVFWAVEFLNNFTREKKPGKFRPG